MAKALPAALYLQNTSGLIGVYFYICMCILHLALDKIRILLVLKMVILEKKSELK